MTNEQNNEPVGPTDGDHQIIMKPQEFLNFIGHVTQATVICAITSESLKGDFDKIEDLLKDGKVDEALKEIKFMKRGMHLITNAICKVGSELALHDQAICKACDEKGLEVESQTATHLQRFQEDAKGFIDEFFRATPITKVMPRPNKPKPKPEDEDPFGPKSRFN